MFYALCQLCLDSKKILSLIFRTSDEEELVECFGTIGSHSCRINHRFVWDTGWTKRLWKQISKFITTFVMSSCNQANLFAIEGVINFKYLGLATFITRRWEIRRYANMSIHKYIIDSLEERRQLAKSASCGLCSFHSTLNLLIGF